MTSERAVRERFSDTGEALMTQLRRQRVSHNTLARVEAYLGAIMREHKAALATQQDAPEGLRAAAGKLADAYDDAGYIHGMSAELGWSVRDLRAALASTEPVPAALSGWEELRREIEALMPHPRSVVDRAAVLAIVDRLAAARGEPPEPGPAIDRDRLVTAMNVSGWVATPDDVEELAAEYDRLRP